MYIEKLFGGNSYQYDTINKLYLNPTTNKWVKKPRQSKGKAIGKAISKIESKRRMYSFSDLDFTPITTSPEIAERIKFFLTKVDQIVNNYKSRKDFYTANIFEDEEEQNYYAWISDKLVNVLLGKEYRTIRLQLHEIGLLNLTAGRGVFGSNVFQYSLTDKALKSRGNYVNISFLRVDKSIRKYYAIKKRDLKEADERVFDWIKNIKFKITREQFIEEAEALYPQYVEEKTLYFNEVAGKREIKKGLSILTKEQYVKGLMVHFQNIEDWNAADVRDEVIDYISIDKFGNRFHSIFSRVPAFCRKYITHKNIKDVASADLAQSQPTILAQHMFELIGENKFTTTVSTEDIYNSFKLPSRKIAKLAMFKMIFNHEGTRWFEFFKKHYPEVGNEILNIQSAKPRFKADNTPVKKNAYLAQDMQIFEAKMFRKIWAELIRLGVRFVPVHDGIYFDKSETDIVMNAMNQIIGKHLTDVDFKVEVENI